MDLATRWSNLFVGMSPASFFNFSFLPKYGVYFLQALGYTDSLAMMDSTLKEVSDLLGRPEMVRPSHLSLIHI